MAKPKQATWFKVFSHQRPLMDAVPDALLGKVMKAAMAYFETGEAPQLDTLENAVFAVLRAGIDEAVADYEKKAENGRKGGRPKKEKKPNKTTPNLPQAPETEAEAEADAEAEAEAEADADAEAETEEEKEICLCVSPATPGKQELIPPDVEQVAAYCRQVGSQIDPARFVDHYTATGWRIGKSPMQDWKAMVRSWGSDHAPRAAPNPALTWGFTL